MVPIVIVGGIVSTMKSPVEPPVPGLPAASVKLEVSRLTEALVIDVLGSGVKVAV